ncbi:MAG: hypothetical protein HKO77_00865 [Gemmatimonadetes bacterium]|nr:hypothetical protein [Gemmatimonadota bacterium]
MNIGVGHYARQLLERLDVGDPDRPPVRAGDDLAVTGVDLEVVDRHRGQPGHEALPRVAPVHGGIGADVGSDEEEVRIHVVFAYHVHEVGLSGGQVAGDGAEALPTVLTHKHVWSEVAAAVVVVGDVDPVAHVFRGLDTAHIRAVGNQTIRGPGQLHPLAPGVRRHPQVSVVGAGV